MRGALRRLLAGALLVAVALVGVGVGSCGGGDPHKYDRNDLELVVGYAAKEVCTCVFLMEQSEEFCRAWTRASPNVNTIRVDTATRTVEAQAILLWGARARFVGPREGCIVE